MSILADKLITKRKEKVGIFKKLMWKSEKNYPTLSKFYPFEVNLQSKIPDSNDYQRLSHFMKWMNNI